MKPLFLPYVEKLDKPNSTWVLVGRDARRRDFGVGAGPTREVAQARLRDWILDSMLAAAADGQDLSKDLVSVSRGRPAVMFTPLELIPIRLRLLRARHGLSQAQVADRLRMTQQAYAKLERPGANLQLKTIQQVETALNEELLQLA
jgi:DNA-binding XRE family transcriptional regulator